ncbi:purine-binding chemotaxis protein CheW [Nostoc sp. FACHB-152]|uniref:chemotaxis protein CheW n=1 Tax=unclassified Nostoc TaxID=2593658 RepID=UPI001686F0D0|nr:MULTISPECIES: chemotaxis protein CheW [unclassified Nostoc]MBD2448284.1 purine-binding chemotaxis protein CheW [Nostoc sp. FACHB-152]MBD2467446.1 purine-binding chemotaxis protein CheW [Nostoc sp. FACHB-145]
MLLLLFYINNQRYALASQQVIEVLPLVSLNILPHAPDYFAGVFNYRGQVVPVLDLCQLMSGKPCSQHLSSRIILVNYWGGDVAKSSVVGLMAERVVETLHKSNTELVDTNVQIGAAPYLGKMILDEQGMIQCLRIEYLLSESEQVYLLPAN